MKKFNTVKDHNIFCTLLVNVHMFIVSWCSLSIPSLLNGSLTKWHVQNCVSSKISKSFRKHFLSVFHDIIPCVHHFWTIITPMLVHIPQNMDTVLKPNKTDFHRTSKLHEQLSFLEHSWFFVNKSHKFPWNIIIPPGIRNFPQRHSRLSTVFLHPGPRLQKVAGPVRLPAPRQKLVVAKSHGCKEQGEERSWEGNSLNTHGDSKRILLDLMIIWSNIFLFGDLMVICKGVLWFPWFLLFFWIYGDWKELSWFEWTNMLV